MVTFKYVLFDKNFGYILSKIVVYKTVASKNCLKYYKALHVPPPVPLQTNSTRQKVSGVRLSRILAARGQLPARPGTLAGNRHSGITY